MPSTFRLGKIRSFCEPARSIGTAWCTVSRSSKEGGSATLGVGDKIIHATRGDVELFEPAQDHVLLEASGDLDLFVVALRPDLAARACGSLVHACAQACQLSEGETVQASEALHASADSGTPTDIETTLAALFRSLKARAAPSHVLSRLTVERVSQADVERLRHLGPRATSRP